MTGDSHMTGQPSSAAEADPQVAAHRSRDEPDGSGLASSSNAELADGTFLDCPNREEVRHTKSIRIDRRFSLNLTIRSVVRARVFRSDFQSLDMSPAGADYYRCGCAPELVAQPQRDGGVLLAMNRYDSSSVTVLRMDSHGRVGQKTAIEIGSRPTIPGTTRRTMDALQSPAGAGNSHLAADSRNRLAGFVATPAGFSLAYTDFRWRGEEGPTTSQGRIAVASFDHAGARLSELDDALDTSEDPDSKPLSTGWTPMGPSLMSSSRLAFGGGMVCLHTARLIRGPDGSILQGGFARVMTPARSRDTQRVQNPGQAIAPWVASRSLDQRCVFDTYRGRFILATLADGFPRGVLLTAIGPGQRSSFLLQSFAGEPGAGDLAAELGGLVVNRETYAVSFCAAVQTQPESRDTFVSFAVPEFTGTPLTLRVSSNPPGSYSIDPKLAALGTNLLVAWKRVTPRTGEVLHQVAVVTPQAQTLVPPTVLDGMFFHRPDDFVTDARGSVNWFASASDDVCWIRLSLGRSS